jgi:hypothetical protein
MLTNSRRSLPEVVCANVKGLGLVLGICAEVALSTTIAASAGAVAKLSAMNASAGRPLRQMPSANMTVPAATAGIHARVSDLTGSLHHGVQATDFHTDNACENGSPMNPLLIRDSNVP